MITPIAVMAKAVSRWADDWRLKNNTQKKGAALGLHLDPQMGTALKQALLLEKMTRGD